MIITGNLFQTVLIGPCNEGADKLRIVSGYATSAMASRHLAYLQEINPSVKVSLLVGMCPTDGIALGNHNGFRSLTSDRFVCSYITAPPSVHGKLYLWYKGDSLLKSFIGSANYTQNAFFSQREVLSEFSDPDVTSYYESLERDSIFCTHCEVDEAVRVHNDRHYYNRHPNEDTITDNNLETFNTEGLPSIRVSLLTNQGNVQRRVGLNWGQRPGRDHNQAYIQLPPPVYRSDFFPERPDHFTILTDDSKSLICVRAEKLNQHPAGCAIHSIPNSRMGEYFRNRLSVASGAFITAGDLQHYGRTDVVFYKLDNENYYMDFSVH